MKILSFHIENNMIHVITDNPGRPEFVYEENCFDTKEKLIAEIERSIVHENTRKVISEMNLSFVSADLLAIGAVDNTKIDLEDLNAND